MPSISPIIFVVVVLFPLTFAIKTNVDIAIIGGGTSGCALAYRLCTALPSFQFILLERSNPRNKTGQFISSSPRNIFRAWDSDVVSEQFFSLQDPDVAYSPSKIVTGKTLGGSSAVNGLQWTLPMGNAEGFGISGLNDENAMQLYKKAFRMLGVRVPGPGMRQKYTGEYLKAGKLAGYSIGGGGAFDRRVRSSVWQNRVAVDSHGRRMDSCRAYLGGKKKCKNLKIIPGATVNRVLIAGKRAFGVEYVKNGNLKAVKVSREVVVSAGPFGSPKVLMLSGIGPRDVLKKAGVEVKVELGVGERTQARVFTPLISLYKMGLDPVNNSTVVNSKKTRGIWEGGRGGILGTSVFAVNGVMGKLAYFIAGFVGFVPQLDDVNVLASFCVSNPEGFGWVRVKSKNVFEPMMVRLNLLGTHKEVQNTVKCVKELKRIHGNFGKAFGLQGFLPKNGDEINEKFVNENSQFAYHFVGANAVGTVVSDRLKVKGLEGLRVVDASVIRRMPISAGPMSSTYMIAEYVGEKLGICYKEKLKRKWLTSKGCRGWI